MLGKRYGRALVAAPYSKTVLADSDDRFFQIAPYAKNEWIVTNSGEHIGSVKKLKSGWTMSPTWAAGRQKEFLERAIRLLDAHLAGTP